jgi:hypothetical protein
MNLKEVERVSDEKAQKRSKIDKQKKSYGGRHIRRDEKGSIQVHSIVSEGSGRARTRGEKETKIAEVAYLEQGNITLWIKRAGLPKLQKPCMLN